MQEVYYKSITIYYNYDIETKEEIKDTSLPYVGFTKFSTIENFSNPKQHNGFQEIILKDLIFKEYPPTNKLFIAGWSPNMQGDPKLRDGSGISSAYGYTNNDYILNGYNFSINDNGNVGGWNIKYENNKLLGFCIVDNKDFKWNFYLQATLGKIENIWYAYPNKGYAKRYISNIKVNIYKIVLNSR